MVLADARHLPIAAGSVQCVVTSPPYWGLRDYGTATWEGGEPGCDHQPERRYRVNGCVGCGAPHDHETEGCGNCAARRRMRERYKRPAVAYGEPKRSKWTERDAEVNYAMAYRDVCGKCGAKRVDRQLGLEPTPEAYVANMVAVFRQVHRVLRDDGVLFLNLGDSYASIASGLKPKDLCGIPWSVAKALQAPYYTGSIRNAEDRIWLAAMLDSEGCLFIHKRKAGQHNGQGYYRTNDNYGPGIEIANTSLAIIERIHALVGKGSICSQGPDENARRKQTIYRWNLRTIESRDFVRELYPYLVGKQQQARILYGCPSSGERAEAAHAALIALHRTGESGVDFPAPPSMFTPGYYLRSDIIWKKDNPMPESVTDRPTKAHEYVFLLTKASSYYWDAEAVKEPMAPASQARYGYAFGGGKADQRIAQGLVTTPKGEWAYAEGRNIRSVWSIATQPYSGAHFATMPEKLAERCILAGSRPGDLVLDPFLGSGTVARCAISLGRRAVGCDLNPAYLRLADERTQVTRGLPLEMGA